MTTTSLRPVPDQLALLDGIAEWKSQAQRLLDVYEMICSKITAGENPFPNMSKEGERYWLEDRDKLREVVFLIHDLI